jgi:hypothetical protein
VPRTALLSLSSTSDIKHDRHQARQTTFSQMKICNYELDRCNTELAKRWWQASLKKNATSNYLSVVYFDLKFYHMESYLLHIELAEGYIQNMHIVLCYYNILILWRVGNDKIEIIQFTINRLLICHQHIFLSASFKYETKENSVLQFILS